MTRVHQLSMFQTPILAIATSIFAIGCSPAPQHQNNAKESNNVQHIDESKTKNNTDSKKAINIPTYKVYTITSFEPHCFRDKHGNATGFDIDVMNAIGKEAGFKPVYIIQPWNQILPALEKGNADIVASAVMINEERKKKYSFSTPYIVTNLALSVSETYKEHSFTEIISDTNVNYAMISGTAAKTTLTDTLGVAPSKINGLATQYLAIQKVLKDPNTVTFENEAVLRYFGKDFEGLYIKPYTAERVELGFVVQKDNPELLQKINTGLEKIKANGTFDKIYIKWFGDITD